MCLYGYPMGIRAVHNDNINIDINNKYVHIYDNNEYEFEYKYFVVYNDQYEYDNNALRRCFMKIIYNPDNGATIKNIWFKDEFYLDAKDDQAFIPGMVIKVDDEFGQYLIDTWGFLKVLTPAEAKKHMESREEFVCEDCEYKTKVQIAFYNHKKKHVAESKLDELGIPSIGSKKNAENTTETNIDRQKKWDDEDSKEGLTGEGLTDDK